MTVEQVLSSCQSFESKSHGKNDLFSSADATCSLACLSQLAIATLVFVSMRLLASLTSVFTKGKLIKAEAQDAYILLVNPTFFLWAALFLGVTATANPEAVRYAIFWAALRFFCIPLIEQILFMNSFEKPKIFQRVATTAFAVVGVTLLIKH